MLHRRRRHRSYTFCKWGEDWGNRFWPVRVMAIFPAVESLHDAEETLNRGQQFLNSELWAPDTPAESPKPYY